MITNKKRTKVIKNIKIILILPKARELNKTTDF